MPSILSSLATLILSPLVAYSNVFQTISSVPGAERPFVVRLNGIHPMLFDTGSETTWIKSFRVVPYGYNTNNKSAVNQPATVNYPLEGTVYMPYSVDDILSIDQVRWRQLLPILDSGGQFVPWHGILGASLNSVFTQTFHVITIVPYPNHFKVHVGEAFQIHSRKCYNLPISKFGLSVGKWTVRGAIQVDNSAWRYTYFEVDTGCSTLSLSLGMWELYKKRMQARGAQYAGAIQRAHVFNNCFPQSIPGVSYLFGGENETITISPESYVLFEPAFGRCTVRVIVHDVRSFRNMSYIGVPILSALITQLDSRKKSVTFCERS